MEAFKTHQFVAHLGVVALFGFIDEDTSEINTRQSFIWHRTKLTLNLTLDKVDFGQG